MNPHRHVVTFVLLVVLAGLTACKENRTETKQVGLEKPASQEPEQIVVGRITFLEKNLFRYLQDLKDWTLAFRDVPVTTGDVLYSAVQGRSELTFPNETKVRLNDNTKIKLDGIKGDLTSVYLHSGAVRIQNRGGAIVKVDTPYGQMLSQQPSTFDVFVGPSSTVVTSINGTARFIDAKDKHYDVNPESVSLVADQNSAGAFRHYRDQRWDEWNSERDNESSNRERDPSPYLPSQLQSDAKVLADNGKWEQITVEGENANLWTPTNVSPDWSPFTVGQWTTWNDEQLWVPYEPFGWVTHHHGGWNFLRNRWYWRPPVVAGWRVLPWYPARAVWVHHGRYVGWVPCGWREVYYGRRYWGPRTVVVRENIHIRNVDIRKYVNVNKTVIVDKERLYNVRGKYERVKDTRITKEVVNNGRATAGVYGDAARGVDVSKAHHFARTGDFSHKPQFAVAKEFETRQERLASKHENVKALNEKIAKANPTVAGARTIQAMPFDEKSGQKKGRDLPETPQKSAQVKGPGQRPESTTNRKLPVPQDQQQVQTQRQQHLQHNSDKQQQAQTQRQLQQQKHQLQQQHAQTQRQQQLEGQKQATRQQPLQTQQVEQRKQQQLQLEARRQQQMESQRQHQQQVGQRQQQLTVQRQQQVQQQPLAQQQTQQQQQNRKARHQNQQGERKGQGN